MTVILHTLCSLLSYVAFLIAFISALLFLAQERQLKRKHMGMLFHRLPPLGTLDRINFAAIGVGFGLLSLGVICGFVSSWLRFGSWWRWDPKELLTIAMWAAYLVLWIIRARASLRGRKVALLSILGFGLVLLTFLGVSRLVPSWHAYL